MVDRVVRMFCRALVVGMAVATVGSADALAGPITYPDLTVFDLDVSGTPPGTFYADGCYSGGAPCMFSLAVDANPLNNVDYTNGGFFFDWGGSNAFSVSNLTGPIVLLAGTITSFAQNGATSYAFINLTTSNIAGFGSVARIDFSGFGGGTAQADITPVPELGTLSLVALGVTTLTTRRRAQRRLMSSRAE